MYDGFYPKNLIGNFKTYPGRRTIRFFSVNTDDELSVSQAGISGMKSFINFITPPKPLVFKYIMLDSIVVQSGYQPETHRLNCSDPILVNTIVQSIKKNTDVDLFCAGNHWQFLAQSSFYPVGFNSDATNKILCVNCESPLDCIDTYANRFVFGSSDICFSKDTNGAVKTFQNTNRAIRTAVYLQIATVPYNPLIAPSIQSIGFIPGRTNITAIVTFIGHPPGGHVYCAFTELNTMTFTDIYQLKLMAKTVAFRQSTSVSSATIVIQVTSTNLYSASAYDVLCAVEDSFYNIFDINQLIMNKNTISTLCCRTISFTNVPAYVYGVLTAYENVINSKLNVFSYAIDISSKDTLTVYHIVLDADTGNIVYNVAVFPSSIKFYNNKKKIQTLTGSFILSCADVDENGEMIDCFGKYIVSFRMVGLSSSLYANDKLQVRIMNKNIPPPPPVLDYAQFANSGAYLLIWFTSPTDQAISVGLDNTIPWSCDSLFNFTSAAKTQCVWINSFTVKVLFYSDPTIQFLEPEDAITLKGGLIKAAYKLQTTLSEYVPADEMTIIVKRPLNPLLPTSTLFAPELLSSCDDLVLDATSTTGE